MEQKEIIEQIEATLERKEVEAIKTVTDEYISYKIDGENEANFELTINEFFMFFNECMFEIRVYTKFPNDIQISYGLFDMQIMAENIYNWELF